MGEVIKSGRMLHLSDKQRRAIQEIVQGKTDGQVADIVGLSRKTINTWRNENPFFQAELNVAREEAWNVFTREYKELAEDSFKLVKKAIGDGDIKTAIWFFEKAGLGSVIHSSIGLNAPRGMTNPDEIIWNRAIMIAEENIKDRPKDFLDDSPFEDQNHKKRMELQEEREKVFRELKEKAFKEQSKIEDEAA